MKYGTVQIIASSGPVEDVTLGDVVDPDPVLLMNKTSKLTFFCSKSDDCFSVMGVSTLDLVTTSVQL